LARIRRSMRVEQSVLCSGAEWGGRRRHTSFGRLNSSGENPQYDLVVGLAMEDSSRSLVECIFFGIGPSPRKKSRIWPCWFDRTPIVLCTVTFLETSSRRTFWENKFHHHFFCCWPIVSLWLLQRALCFLFVLLARYILDVFLDIMLLKRFVIGIDILLLSIFFLFSLPIAVASYCCTTFHRSLTYTPIPSYWLVFG
jgi:hypothetical protein